MENYKEKYELGSIVTATRTFNRETITGEFGGFHLLDKSNPKSIVGVVHTPNDSYDVEPNSIESVISEDEKIRKAIIELVKQSSDILNPTNQNSMIAWLEKQGKVKHTCRNCQAFQDLHQNCPYSPIYQYKDLTEAHKHLDDETNCEFWLEKQEEQPNPYSGI